MTQHLKWKRLLLLVVWIPLFAGYSSPPVVNAQSTGGFNVAVSQIDSSGFPQIKAYVTVTDQNGLPVAGLIEDDFQITEDATQIYTFTTDSATAASEPLALAVALDLSGSMSGQPLSNMISATQNLVNQLAPADKMALVTFTDTVKLLTSPTSDKAQLAADLLTMRVKGDTALWDGVHQAINALAIGPSGRRAVIVVTDGKDNKSLLTLDDVASQAVLQHVPVFPIGFRVADADALGRLAALTGGQAFLQPTSDQLTSQFDAILKRLRQQYLVTYTSQVPSDGAEHRLTVRANVNGVRVEGEGAFIARPIPFTLDVPGFTAGQQIGIGMATHFTPEFSPYAAITTVAYQLDGAPLATVTTRPFEYVWTPAAADQGQRTLTLLATDATGQTQNYSLALEVVPPVTVSIGWPAPGDVLSGTVAFQADVTALSKVAAVDFRVDGKSVGNVTAPPYTLQWQSASATAGDHVLDVVVTDVNGQSAKASAPFHVQVGINWGLFGALAIVLVALGVILPVSLRSQRNRRASGQPAAAAAPTGAPSPGEAALMLEAGPGQGQRWLVGTGDTRIGRRRAENDVVLLSSDVSRQQGIIHCAGGAYTYTNLSQSLPALINGQPASAQQPLADGDRIQIGQFVLKFIGPGRTPEA